MLPQNHVSGAVLASGACAHCTKVAMAFPFVQAIVLPSRTPTLQTSLASSQVPADCTSQLVLNVVRPSVCGMSMITSDNSLRSAAGPAPYCRPDSIIRIHATRRLQNVATCSKLGGGDVYRDEAGSSLQSDLQVEALPKTISEMDYAKKGMPAWVPKVLVPYAQLARMEKLSYHAGAWLFMWPCYWGAALAAKNGSAPDLKVLALFGISAVVFHGAACAINDLCDMNFDGKVERTKLRPLVTGAITPLQGWAFFGCQVLLCWVVLLQLQNFSQVQVLGVIYLFLNCTYPLMKRWTYWPQAYLGLAVNWGALIAWAVVRGPGDFGSMVILPLYAAACTWTLVYETIYAHQDRESDAKAGVKSTGVILSASETRRWLTGFAIAFAAGLNIAGYNAGLGWPFYVGVAAATGHLAWQILDVDIENAGDCATKFHSNKWPGAFVFVGIMCGKLLA